MRLPIRQRLDPVGDSVDRFPSTGTLSAIPTDDSIDRETLEAGIDRYDAQIRALGYLHPASV